MSTLAAVVPFTDGRRFAYPRSPPVITILERSDDAEGRATKAWLDARSIPYAVIGVAANPDIDFLLHSLGFAAQHVVEVKTSVGVSRFENHRPDLLEALCGTVAA